MYRILIVFLLLISAAAFGNGIPDRKLAKWELNGDWLDREKQDSWIEIRDDAYRLTTVNIDMTVTKEVGTWSLEAREHCNEEASCFWSNYVILDPEAKGRPVTILIFFNGALCDALSFRTCYRRGFRDVLLDELIKEEQRALAQPLPEE